MTRIRQSFLQTKWSSVEIGHKQACYIYSYIKRSILYYCGWCNNTKHVHYSDLFSFVCNLQLCLIKKTNTHEEAKVFGLNGADPNFVSSTIMENV